MSWQLQAHAALLERPRTALVLCSLPKLARIFLMSAAIQGCAAPPVTFPGPDPSDASVPIPPVSYQPVTGAFPAQRPVEPMPWAKENEPAAPALGAVPEPKS
jgi:hypothetical protein